ncbi:Nicotianamine synthase [Paraphoma chrysanthemicola]|uniref:Nicotianamine synthase n=1 Tax=Paraphoma chrysanthemicola TaxID=798071 RepID=A0A8K0RG81_9PLEO|nr:Nicotianamine synthase [Paraphoma chrysanthemicola]
MTLSISTPSEPTTDRARKPTTPKTKSSSSESTSSITPPHTPTALSTSAHALLTTLHEINTTILTLPSLAPSPTVNTLLTHLVDLCIAPYPPSFSTYFFSLPSVTPLCTSLRPLCATAEGLLEAHWASRMLATARSSPTGTTPEEVLRVFPYYGNYVDLSRLECNTLATYLPLSSGDGKNDVQSVAFLGSGPLPLSSMCMLSHFPRAKMYNVDRDTGALAMSRELCVALGYERMEFVGADVNDVTGDGRRIEAEKQEEWMQSDVVFLAALVGEDTPSKIGILEGLVRRLRPGTLVVARSARGMRGVVYPVLELTEEIEKVGLEILVEVHPWTKVVNSVVVMRVKER